MDNKERKKRFNAEVSELKCNEQLRFCNLVNKQKDLDSEFNEVVNSNFWNLLKP